MDLKAQLLGTMVPACICASIIVICYYAFHKKSSEKSNCWSIALGLASGYAFAHWAIVGEIPPFPVDVEEYENYNWFIYIAGGIAVLAIINSFTTNIVPKILFFTIAASISTWLIIPEYFLEEKSTLTFWSWHIGYVLLALTLFMSTEKYMEKADGKWISLLFFLIATGASLTGVFFASAKIGQLCGAIAAMSMSIFVISWILPNLSWNRSGTYFIAIVLPGLLLTAYFATDEETAKLWSIALISCAPLFVSLSNIKPIPQLATIQRNATKLLFPLISIGIAVAIAYSQY